MKQIFIIGAGGHARACIDIIESTKLFKILALVDSKKNQKKIFKYKNINEKLLLKKNKKKFKKINLIIGIGQIKNNSLRKKKYIEFKRNGFKFPKVTSKFSYISKYSKLAEGTLVCHHVVINSGVRIGVNCIINNKALIEHDVIIGNHCHISTGALINGGVVIGSNTFIGSGTIIKENVKIGSDCVVGAGLTIKKNIKSNSLVK